MTHMEFKQSMLNRYCRNCINEQLGISLSTQDCGYAIYPNQCQQCGEMKNIVERLQWSGRFKVVFTKKK